MVNKLTPIIRFDGFTDDWEQRKLSEMMTFSNGINAPKENYGKGRNMISVMDILSPAFIEYKNIKNSVQVDKISEDKNKVEFGDLVFVRSSEIVEEVGWAKAYLDNDYALYSGFTIRGKKKSKFNSYFIELVLNYSSRKQIESKSGGSTRYNVSQSILNSIEILVPNDDEQEKISSFFKQLDETITHQERKLKLLKEQKKGYLQKMFPKQNEKVPELRFAGFTDDWEQRECKKVCSISTGKSNTQDKTDDGEYPFYVRSATVERSNKYLYDEEAVLTVGDGVGTGKVYHFVKGKYDLHQRVYRMFDFKSEVTIRYFFYYFSNKFYKRVQAMTAKTSVDSVRLEMIADMKISFPTEKEQTKIGNFFKKLDETITLQERKLEQMKEMKKAFLQKMFV